MLKTNLLFKKIILWITTLSTAFLICMGVEYYFIPDVSLGINWTNIKKQLRRTSDYFMETQITALTTNSEVNLKKLYNTEIVGIFYIFSSKYGAFNSYLVARNNYRNLTSDFQSILCKNINVVNSTDWGTIDIKIRNDAQSSTLFFKHWIVEDNFSATPKGNIFAGGIIVICSPFTIFNI